jgi:cardiolipin synthase (CMP-forming)
MNIPNFLSLLRILLVPVMVIFLMQGSFVKALIILAVSGITDALDGFLARVLKQQTVLGAYLDPIADKALLVSCYITLSIKGIIPSWLTVIVISRDVMIMLGIAIFSMMSLPFEMRPAFISKVTTAVQLITVLFALVFRIMPGAFDYAWLMLLHWLTAFFTIISGLNYMFSRLRLNNAKI